MTLYSSPLGKRWDSWSISAFTFSAASSALDPGRCITAMTTVGLFDR